MDNQNDKKMRKLLLVLFISNICYSQSEVVSLSIEDAVKYGIENNRNLKNAEREKYKWHIRKGGKLSQSDCLMYH